MVLTLLMSGGCDDSSSAQSQPATESLEIVNCPDVQKAITLIKRLEGYPGFSSGEPEVLIGELPADLSIEIPVPEDAKMIGSVTRFADYEYIEMFLDVPREPDEAMAFYRDQLTERGWVEFEAPYSHGGGFSPANLSMPVIFCRDENSGPSISVLAYSLENNGDCGVRLTLDSNLRSSYCSMKDECRPHSFYEDVLPSLQAPEGAVIRGSGGGGGGDSWHSDATIETELGLKEIREHFENQLEEAGWTLEGQGSDERIGWSDWSLTDGDNNKWAGLLLVRDIGKEKTWLLHLRADLVEPGEGSNPSRLPGISYESESVYVE